MTVLYRRLLKAARLAHLFLSMFGLVLLLFFALTGIMLNHEDWFSHYQAEEHVLEGTLPTAQLQKPVDRLALVERLRSEYRVSGPMSSFDESDDEVAVVFKAPGRESRAVVRLDDAAITVTHTTTGLLGRLAYLHRGRASGMDCGNEWSLVIDAACVLLVFVSLTGLVLFLSLKTRRWLGAVALTAGVVVFLGIYFLVVP